MSTPTAAQIDALLDFHRELARGSLRSVEGRALSHRLWEEICTTLNSMGGCTKTKTQWQKVWTDKKYLTKKAAAASRRSAFGTGGGPSTVPPLSQWELKVISIMGDGFGEPQTTARVPAFVEVLPEVSTAASSQSIEEGNLPQLHDNLTGTLDNSHPQPGPSQAPVSLETDAPMVHNQISSTPQRRFRRRSVTHADGSVRHRLFQLEERRERCEEQRNEELGGVRVELAGMRVAVIELCRLLHDNNK